MNNHKLQTLLTRFGPLPIVAAMALCVVLCLSASPTRSEQANFRFVVMSDSHNTLGKVGPKDVAAAIVKTNPDIVLHAGDFTCCLSGSPNNNFAFGEHKFLGGIPVFPTVGNHDYDGDAQTGYNAYWKSHQPSVPVDGKWAHSYSFDHKGYHFVALNWKTPNIEWFKNDLKANDGKPTIIFSHATTKVTSDNGYKAIPNATLNEVAKTDPDIRAVFSGHSHCYFVGDVKPGTAQVLTGTVSHDNGRDAKFKRKSVFVVVDVENRKLRICPATVDGGIVESSCSVK